MITIPPQTFRFDALQSLHIWTLIFTLLPVLRMNCEITCF
eukprot:UN13225